MSKKSAFFLGFITGILLCVTTAGLVAGYMWKHRYEVVGKVASTQVAEVAEHFFRALPEGYVTKKKELVLTVLDEFTNSVSRENVTDSEIQGISNAMLIGMEDGHFTYHELDLILTLMHNAAQSPVHNP